MGRPRAPWTEKKIARTRALAQAGLPACDICVLLEDEFGGTCCRETLQARMNEYDIAWPGRTAAGRKNGGMDPWPKAKTTLFVTLWTAGCPGREIIRRLHNEFQSANYYSQRTLNSKARELRLGSRHPDGTAKAPARRAVAMSHVCEVSVLKPRVKKADYAPRRDNAGWESSRRYNEA